MPPKATDENVDIVALEEAAYQRGYEAGLAQGVRPPLFEKCKTLVSTYRDAPESAFVDAVEATETEYGEMLSKSDLALLTSLQRREAALARNYERVEVTGDYIKPKTKLQKPVSGERTETVYDTVN